MELIRWSWRQIEPCYRLFWAAAFENSWQYSRQTCLVLLILLMYWISISWLIVSEKYPCILGTSSCAQKSSHHSLLRSWGHHQRQLGVTCWIGKRRMPFTSWCLVCLFDVEMPCCLMSSYLVWLARPCRARVTAMNSIALSAAPPGSTYLFFKVFTSSRGVDFSSEPSCFGMSLWAEIRGFEVSIPFVELRKDPSVPL